VNGKERERERDRRDKTRESEKERGRVFFQPYFVRTHAAAAVSLAPAHSNATHRNPPTELSPTQKSITKANQIKSTSQTKTGQRNITSGRNQSLEKSIINSKNSHKPTTKAPTFVRTLKGG